MTVGAAAGAGATVWAEVRVRRAVGRLSANELRPAVEVGARARALGRELRAAVEEGRGAMAQREAELRAQLVPAARGLGPERGSSPVRRRPRRREGPPGIAPGERTHLHVVSEERARPLR